MCDSRLLERGLFIKLARLQQGLFSGSANQLENRLEQRLLEANKVKHAPAELLRGSRGNIKLSTSLVEEPAVPSSEGSLAVSSARMKQAQLHIHDETEKHKPNALKLDAPLLVQIAALCGSKQSSNRVLEQLRGILDSLWNDCLSMSNNEQHALRLVEHLGQDGVSSLRVYSMNCFGCSFLLLLF